VDEEGDNKGIDDEEDDKTPTHACGRLATKPVRGDVKGAVVEGLIGRLRGALDF